MTIEKKIDDKFVAVNQEEGAGTLTWWSLRGDLTLDRIKQEWIAASLPEEWLLKPVSATVCIRRALESICDKTTFVETVKTTGELAVVYVEEIDELPVYAPMQKWTLDDNDKPKQTYGDNDVLSDMVRERFETERQTVTTDDVSSWLKRIVVTRLDGILMREHGGVHFVPAAHAATWREVRQFIHRISGHSIASLPMMRSEDAVESILGALVAKAQEDAQTFMDALATANTEDGLKKRGLSSMAERATALNEQLKRYATMLGAAVPSITENIQTLSAGLFAAAAQAGA